MIIDLSKEEDLQSLALSLFDSLDHAQGKFAAIENKYFI